MSSLKRKVASLLRDKKGDFISGEDMAEALGVSRAAVWKNIKALRADGLMIESLPNRGYRLISCEDVLSADGIYDYLPVELHERVRVNVVRTVGSTNKELKNKALSGEQEGYLLVSGHQSEGRGRLGRSFYSPEDTGIYMSLLLKPRIKPQDATLITTAAAVSVCKALERLGVKNPAIKWVNDIFINGKKVCGILTEAGFDIENNSLDYAVLGVGINMYAPEEGFPEELSQIAGAVFSVSGEDVRNKFTAWFLEAFYNYYDSIESRRHIEEYSQKCFVIGKRVDVISGDSVMPAVALGVDGNCCLTVRLEDGQIKTLSSGEISIKPV